MFVIPQYKHYLLLKEKAYLISSFLSLKLTSFKLPPVLAVLEYPSFVFIFFFIMVIKLEEKYPFGWQSDKETAFSVIYLMLFYPIV